MFTFNSVITQLMSGIGFFILLVSAFYLWPSLRISPIPRKKSPFIKKGIYKYFRHPMYFAVIIIAASILLNNFTEITFIVFVALYLVLRTKADMEENLLQKIHGKSFFKKNTIFPLRGI